MRTGSHTGSRGPLRPDPPPVRVPPPVRAVYAARQADLLDALMCGDAYPAGFDLARAEAAGHSLRRKRARAIRHAWPALATALGRDFQVRVDAFLSVHPSSAGGLADGLDFAQWLGQASDREPHSHRPVDPVVTDNVRIEITLARARLHRLFVGVRRLDDPRRLIIVFRFPWTRPLVYCLALGGMR